MKVMKVVNIPVVVHGDMVKESLGAGSVHERGVLLIDWMLGHFCSYIAPN